MSNRPTTIESFFLDEYNKLRDEVEELREYKQQQAATLGITDLHRKQPMVKYDVSTAYYWKEYYLKNHNVGVEWFDSLLAMSDDELFKKLNGLDLGGWHNKAITCIEEEFQYTLMIEESRDSWIGYTNGERGDSIVEIPTAPAVGSLVPVEFNQASRDLAISDLRQYLEEVREYLANKIEAEEEAQKE